MTAEERSSSLDEFSDSTAETLTQTSRSGTIDSCDVSEFDPLSQSQSSTGSGTKVVFGKGDLDISHLTASFQSGSSTSLESTSSSVTSTPQRKVSLLPLAFMPQPF